MNHTAIQPDGWAKPHGYSNGILAQPGRTLFVAGQIGWDQDQRLVSSSFVEQFNQALKNVVDVVKAANGQASDICRMTIYIDDKATYVQEREKIGRAYREHMGKHFPAMSLVEVKALLEPGAHVEIEATAMIQGE